MHAFKNNLKTAVLLGLLFGLLVWIGGYFWGMNGVWLFGAIGVATNFVAWFYSDKIAIAAMRCQEVNERSAPHLHRLVEQLAQRAKLPMPRVYVSPHQAPNAFATGRNPRHAAVAVTQGALQLLNHEELEGVLAHELAHIKNRDTLTSAVAATIGGIFSMMAYMAMFGVMGGNRGGGNPLALIGILLAPIGAAIVKAAIGRSREYVADAEGAQIAGSPDGLASALHKLETVARRMPLQNPNPAMNNMFIVEPFVGRTLTNLFASHPPTEKRIAALMRMR